MATFIVSLGTVATILAWYQGLPPLPESGRGLGLTAAGFILGFCGLGLFADWDR